MYRLNRLYRQNVFFFCFSFKTKMIQLISPSINLNQFGCRNNKKKTSVGCLRNPSSYMYTPHLFHVSKDVLRHTPKNCLSPQKQQKIPKHLILTRRTRRNRFQNRDTTVSNSTRFAFSCRCRVFYNLFLFESKQHTPGSYVSNNEEKLSPNYFFFVESKPHI